MAKKNAPDFPKELLGQLFSGHDSKTALDSGGLIDDLKKALAQRMLNAETDVHLAKAAEAGVANHHHGTSDKTVLTPEGELELSIPRDRHGRLDPALIGKYRQRFPGFDDKIIALYARRMSTRDIQHHVRELYGLEISPDLVSAVTDSVLDEVAAWQARPLEPSYAIVFFDALRVKIRDEGL
jgi:putative transposase